VLELSVNKLSSSLASYRKRTKFTMPIWDPYLVEDFLFTFLFPAVGYLSLFTDSSLRAMLRCQYPSIYRDKKLVELMLKETAAFPECARNAAGQFIKNRINKQMLPFGFELMETTLEIKEAFFDKRMCGDDIEKQKMKACYDVVKQRDAVRNEVEELDFIIAYYQIKRNAKISLANTYDNIVHRMEYKLAITHFMNENLLQEIEKRSLELKERNLGLLKKLNAERDREKKG